MYDQAKEQNPGGQQRARAKALLPDLAEPALLLVNGGHCSAEAARGSWDELCESAGRCAQGARTEASAELPPRLQRTGPEADAACRARLSLNPSPSSPSGRPQEGR